MGLIFEAPPLSRGKIIHVAEQFRNLFGLDDPYLPVDRLVEHMLPQAMPGYEFDVLDRADMQDRHGYWDPVRRTLALRVDVYEGVVAGKGRDRSTAMHEVGHAVLHRATLNRVLSDVALPSYRDPEWQAQTFSAAVLMPPRMVAQCRTIQEVTDEFGVTARHAEVWIEKARIRLKEKG